MLLIDMELFHTNTSRPTLIRNERKKVTVTSLRKSHEVTAKFRTLKGAIEGLRYRMQDSLEEL